MSCEDVHLLKKSNLVSNTQCKRANLKSFLFSPLFRRYKKNSPYFVIQCRAFWNNISYILSCFHKPTNVKHVSVPVGSFHNRSGGHWKSYVLYYFYLLTCLYFVHCCCNIFCRQLLCCSHGQRNCGTKTACLVIYRLQSQRLANLGDSKFELITNQYCFASNFRFSFLVHANVQAL